MNGSTHKEKDKATTTEIALLLESLSRERTIRRGNECQMAYTDSEVVP